MVIKTDLCAFSGLKIWPGHGQRYVRVDNRVSFDCIAAFRSRT